eukprot:m.151840 g.151840  ORF g.151840 m.151840 type:complete len:213 (-) comp23367_c0_seq2:182-820(-)
MPKVISRSIIVTDQDDEVEALTRHHTYFCLCGKLAMVAEVDVHTLAQRKLDGARLVPTSAKFKLESAAGPTVVIARDGGKERQHQQVCTRCQLPLAYRPRKDSDAVYIIDGALLREDEDHSVPRAPGAGESASSAMRRNTKQVGKYTSVSMATTTAEEEAALESQELGRNYDANAKVIEMMLGRSAAGMKRDAMAKAKAEKPTKRRKGTLLA